MTRASAAGFWRGIRSRNSMPASAISRSGAWRSSRPISTADLRAPPTSPRAEVLTDVADAAALVEAEADAIAHMNADHAEACRLYATKLLGAPDGGWACVGIDPEGLELQKGSTALRLFFPQRVTGPGPLRAMLKQLADAGAGALRPAAVVNAPAGCHRTAESAGRLMAQTSAPLPSRHRLNLLMQRNDDCFRCMGFSLGFQIVRDYGRAPLDEGLY